MQRNWDVVRKILLKAEALPTEDSQVNSDEIDGVAPEVAAYHMRLLREAGLIEGGGRAAGAVGAPPWLFATRLTWEGHEFLDSIRRDTVWNRIKTKARDQGVELTIDAIKMIARAVIEGMLRS